MNTYPALTISLLSQLTNRELQSNYLNHLDRTFEVASLLKQITDPDLALRIVNLALEVDLNLGASLTSSLAPELQKIVVDRIDRLEIPTRLKIELWHTTKSKSALPYLQDIFIHDRQQPNTWEGHREIESATSTIIHIDRDLAVSLLIEELHHPQRYDRASDLGRSVFKVFSDDGKLGVVPQLWSAHRQTYFDGGLSAISKIQQREGLYNPEFSDRSHPLFEPPRNRLRQFLLGDTDS